MNRDKIRKAIADAIKDLRISELSDEELGIEVIDRIARLSEGLANDADQAALAKNRGTLFQAMTKPDFGKWLRQAIAVRVKELICGSLYLKIDTPEERAAVIDKYDDKIADAVISSYPSLALARPVIVRVAAVVLALGLARAAEDLGGYCGLA